MSSHWKNQTLGEVCKFQRGLVYAKKDEVQTSSNAVLRANNIDLATNKLNLEEIRYISDDITVPESRKVTKGSIIVCTASGSKSHLGKVALIDEDCDYAFGGFMGLITAEPHIHPKFLFYAMTSQAYKEFIGSLSNGMNINNLKFDDLRLFAFPVPPLPEQQRVAAILDEAFEGISMAVSNAEKNLANARELFDSYLDSIFITKGAGSVETTLGKVCKFHGGSQPPKSVFSADSGPEKIRLIQIRDYKSDRHVVFIPKSLARRFCDTTDVMIGRYGPPLFQILRGLDGAYNVALMKAVPDQSVLSKDYLFYFLKNRHILRYIIHASNRAAGQIGLNKETLEPYPISFPALKEQSKIVSRIGEIAAQQENLERIYEAKLNALTELKRTILHKAFTGELTARPEKILEGVAA